MDTFKIKGVITVKLFGPDGKIKDERVVENIVTNAGRAAIIDRLQGNTPAVPDYIAIGSGTAAAAASDTALGTELARAQGSLTQPTAYTDRCTYTFAAGTGTGSVGEVVRFNASSGPTLWGRQLIDPVVAKGSADSLQIQYDFTYAAA